VGSILNYASVCYSRMARTHFLKLERLQYRSLILVLGLMQSTPNNSLGVLSGVSPLAKTCMYLNYRYLVTVYDKHVSSFEGTASNPEQVELRKMYERICIGGPVHVPTIKNLCTI
jgi:hypothetical protein